MKYIYSVLPYFSDDYTSKIKQSIPGEALIFGNCVPMPLQVKITQANPDPNSENCDIRKEWFTIKETRNPSTSLERITQTSSSKKSDRSKWEETKEKE